VATIYGRRPGLFPAGRNVSLASGVTMTRQTAKAVSAAITQAVSLSRQISHVIASSSAQAVTIVRTKLAPRTITLTTGSVVTHLESMHNIAIATGQSVTIGRNIAKTITIQLASAVAHARATNQDHRDETAVANVVTLVRSTGKIISPTLGSSVTLEPFFAKTWRPSEIELVR
jgi:hypothetical protein